MRYTRLLLLLVALTSPAWAQAKPIEVIPPGPDRILPLPKGQPAPFDGQLFENDTALRWANWLRQYKLRLQVDVEEQQSICTVRTDAVRQQLGVEQTKYMQMTSAYELRLLQLQLEYANPPWYKSPVFYTTLGVVGTAALVAGGAFAAHQF